MCCTECVVSSSLNVLSQGSNSSIQDKINTSKRIFMASPEGRE